MLPISSTGPLAYLLTFRSHGTWLPGDARGWVDRSHRMPGSAYVPAAPGLELQLRAEYRPGLPMRLCARRRGIVHETILAVCAYRGYVVHALNVRTNHVHVVVTAGVPPEAVMNDLKVWATRRLRAASAVEAGDKVWARHGSTRYLWRQEAVEAACRYVAEGQGEELAAEFPLPDGRGSD